MAIALILIAILCAAILSGRGHDADVYTGKLDINGEYVRPGAHSVLPVTGDYRIVDHGNGLVDLFISVTAGDGAPATREVHDVPVIWKCSLLEGNGTLLENVDLIDRDGSFFSGIAILENGSGLFSVAYGYSGTYSVEGILDEPLNIRPLARDYSSVEPRPVNNGTVQIACCLPPVKLVKMQTCEGPIYVTPLKEIPRRKTVVT